MLTVKNIRKMVGGQRVLNKASFSLGEGQKAALVGLNGVGKSTLLRIVSGIESADQGSITKPNRVLMGYLPQEVIAFRIVESYALGRPPDDGRGGPWCSAARTSTR